MAYGCQAVAGLVARAHELGAPEGGYFTVYWEAEDAYGYFEVKGDALIKDVRYSMDPSHCYYEEVEIPKDAVVTCVTKGYVGPVIYKAAS